MTIRELILQRIEQLLLTRNYSEQELCFMVMQYINQAYSEALHLKFVQWRDLETIRKDLFTLPSEQEVQP